MLALVTTLLVSAAGAAIGQADFERAPRGEYVPERTLVLRVPDTLKVGGRALVVAEGFARAGDQLSAFAIPRASGCPLAAAGLPTRAVPLISEVLDQGVFRLDAIDRPRRRGERSFCAYLRPLGAQVDLHTGEVRTVDAKRLRAAAARRTVTKALRRHGFAKRVVKSLERRCKRLRRDAFGCRFKVKFPGYRLRGKGKVRLGIELSYRFKVKAQGVRFILTDENEQRRTG